MTALPLSRVATAEIRFQPSLRDLILMCFEPSVETLGYFRQSLRDIFCYMLFVQMPGSKSIRKLKNKLVVILRRIVAAGKFVVAFEQERV